MVRQAQTGPWRKRLGTAGLLEANKWGLLCTLLLCLHTFIFVLYLQDILCLLMRETLIHFIFFIFFKDESET